MASQYRLHAAEAGTSLPLHPQPADGFDVQEIGPSSREKSFDATKTHGDNSAQT
jgi:hypothetical protein